MRGPCVPSASPPRPVSDRRGRWHRARGHTIKMASLSDQIGIIGGKDYQSTRLIPHQTQGTARDQQIQPPRMRSGQISSADHSLGIIPVVVMGADRRPEPKINAGCNAVRTLEEVAMGTGGEGPGGGVECRGGGWERWRMERGEVGGGWIRGIVASLSVQVLFKPDIGRNGCQL